LQESKELRMVQIPGAMVVPDLHANASVFFASARRFAAREVEVLQRYLTQSRELVVTRGCAHLKRGIVEVHGDVQALSSGPERLRTVKLN